jgi:hypothetical protein
VTVRYHGQTAVDIAASVEGYVGKILVVVDVEDPSDPKEVGRWWWPGQHTGGGETPEEPDMNGLHGPATSSAIVRT